MGEEKGEEIVTMTAHDWLSVVQALVLTSGFSLHRRRHKLVVAWSIGQATSGQNYKNPALPPACSREKTLARKSRSVGPTYLPHTSATLILSHPPSSSYPRHDPLFTFCRLFSVPLFAFQHSVSSSFRVIAWASPDASVATDHKSTCNPNRPRHQVSSPASFSFLTSASSLLESETENLCIVFRS